MEGPTPVSALIHAATMVTAGVFLVCRMSPLFDLTHTALVIVTVVGATTAFFAATVGLVQNDIKRVIAYSTCSQLGYMFAAAGVGAYEAAMFHLFTHAFFKALLFLGAGSVIHAMHHEQDMRKMGGLAKKIPITYYMMLIGTLAITGVGIPLTYFGFAGFLSKDIIIESTFAGHNAAHMYAFWMLVIAACMTSFYSWRLIFLTFHGQTRADQHTYDHAHESPAVMLWPLYVLAGGAVLAGMIWYGDFVGHHEGEWWAAAIFNGPDNHVLHDAHNVPKWVKVSPFVAMIIGLAVAYVMYVRSPDIPGKLAARHQPLYKFLLNKWYVDEIYDFLFVRPAMWLGRFLWKRGDGSTIDGFLNGLAMGFVPWLTRFAGRVQSGFVFHYAFAMLLGVAAIITWFAVSGGSH
jgi:NADH-quinone oxidoreductase subunit L